MRVTYTLSVIPLINFSVKEAPGNPDEVHVEHGEEHKAGSVYTDKALEETIDYVLKSMDLNNDGFVDWAEYRKTEANVGKD